jgi:hypothetical protein
MIDVKSNIDNNFEIQVTDLLERNFDMTNKCSSTDNHLELDVSQLLPGVYYLTVSTITEKVRYRVIKI